MRPQFFLATAAGLTLTLSPLAAQTNSAKSGAPASKTAKAYTPPKTAWGDPDLQGEWPANANIPMQRPLTLAEKTSLSRKERARRDEQSRKQPPADSEESDSKGTATITPPGYWVEHTKPNVQTSLVVDPPDGRIPPLTPEGQKRLKELRGGLGPGE